MATAYLPTEKESEMIRDVLEYDAETGIVRWKDIWGNHRRGKEAGSFQSNGYREILVDSRIRLKSHRVAWFLHYQMWPIGVIDHINRNKSDNRIENLRDVCHSTNCQNTETIDKSGAWFDPALGKFRVEIQTNGKRIQLGVFDTIQESRAAYLTAKRLVHNGYVEA